MPTTNPVLRVDAVEKHFGPVRAVNGVSLTAHPGSITALLGPNGAGKTTLLRMIIGMIHPDRGRIGYRLGGLPRESPDPTRIGYLPEERGLYLDVPVRRMLLYFAGLRGMPAREAATEADRWLERFDLRERGDDEVRELSKGNQQKVQFIAAILHRPELAVLDEPFSGLDPVNQDFFLTLIRELAEGGTAVLLSAHQMELVERLADRIILIRRGEAVAEGTVPQLRERWGAGRSLRLRIGGGSPTLEGLPGVRSVTREGEGELRILLEPDASLSPLLAALGNGTEVLNLATESVTLHDIYLRSVLGDEPPAPEAPHPDPAS